MTGLLFIWDEGWFHPNTELVLWHDLAVSFGVDLLIMIPDLKRYNYQDLKFEKYETVEEALKSHADMTYVFLEPPDVIEREGLKGESIADFKHPDNALYIFGASNQSNIGLVDLSRGDKLVYIPTADKGQMWGIEVASIVLYDRVRKAGLI